MAKELKNTIVIENSTGTEETFNINAVEAELAHTANKLTSKLTLTKVNLTGEESSIEFDGSSNQSLKVVPAGGGSFKGRITVPNIGDTVTDQKSVLNWYDIKNKVVDGAVEELAKTSISYSWDGSNLSAATDIPQSAFNKIHSISIITGNENNLKKFSAYNKVNKKFSTYLYISSGTGNIYFGTYDETEPLKLATNATHIVNELNESESYDYAEIVKLAEELDNLDGKIEEINDSINNSSEGLLARLDAIQPIVTELNRTEVPGLRKDLDNIIGGTTKVPKAELADLATKAVKDTEDKPIHYNYYRSTYKTDRTNSIYFRTAAPTDSDGTEGDIWIVYNS